MTYQEKEVTRLYYSIAEVAEACNVAQSQIRFYDQELSLHIKKNRRGNRKFTEPEVALLIMLTWLGENVFKLKFLKTLKAQQVESFYIQLPILMSQQYIKSKTMTFEVGNPLELPLKFFVDNISYEGSAAMGTAERLTRRYRITISEMETDRDGKILDYTRRHNSPIGGTPMKIL